MFKNSTIKETFLTNEEIKYAIELSYELLELLMKNVCHFPFYIALILLVKLQKRT